MVKKLVLCDCLGSQSIDAGVISAASTLVCSKIYTSLCMEQLDCAGDEMSDGEVMIACQQEQYRFEALAAELDTAVPGFVDLRDRAGWGSGDGTAKMAALVAEAALPVPPVKTRDVVSAGTCLIIGGDAAVRAAGELADILAVTVLLPKAAVPVEDRRFDCVVGRVHTARGSLGGFSVSFNDFQQVVTGGRGSFALTAAQDGVQSHCDIILDLSGAPALFPAPDKRQGYLRGDPKHGVAVAKAVFDAGQLSGTFEKPLYVSMQPALCAHSRASQPACSNCLNVCPTGAISPAGAHVDIDPLICAGCGACAAVCPSGAISYDAPPVGSIFQRLSTLATTYRKAGGRNPRVLLHDGEYGRELIALSARYGDGLPSHVIPLEVAALERFGHAEMLAALATGFEHVTVLISPKTDFDVIWGQAEIASVIVGAAVMTMIKPTNPDELSGLLRNAAPDAVRCPPILPIGSRRQVTRLAAKALRPGVMQIALPANAPYGAITVDTDSCSLCLSCVSLCPTGALGDNADLPQLRFQEDACLQCGLCKNICPENAITLVPQLTLSDTALSEQVLHQEEPFACIQCGALFGVKSTVERISAKLSGTHAMFATSGAAKLIEMCDNCRIQAQAHSDDNPFQGGARPAVRTTADYLSKRKDH
jgi:ferredoxin